MKEIKIKLKSEKKLEFELLEDAKKGDYINLNSINNVDLSDLKYQIQIEKDDEYNKKLKAEITQREREINLANNQSKVEAENIYNSRILELENTINLQKQEYSRNIEFKEKELKNSFEDQINKVKIEKEKTNNSYLLLKEKLENEVSKSKFELEKEYTKKILELENKINLQKQEYSRNIEFKEKELKNSFENRINKLENERTQKIEEYKNLKIKIENDSLKSKLDNEKEYASKILELENKISLQKKEFELEKENSILLLKNEITDLKEKNSLILREKSQNIKLLGNELEDWIENELEKAFGYDERIKIYRQPPLINNQKPDFLIEISHKYNEISKITIEAKTQLNNDGVKKKNRDHLEKLEKYRSKSKSNYAILVSELEIENEFQVYKDSEFKEIFILRPFYLVSFLQFTINLLIINQKVYDANMNFENKQKIIKEWEEFKTGISLSFDRIEKKVFDIIAEKDKVIKSAMKIEEMARGIWDSNLVALRNKLDKFNIEKKIIKEIEKTETDLYSEQMEIKSLYK